ncbi:zinc finger protein 648 [Protobothrops mucrosquamatus]|uniref:zinc finger protein 648 n=1 Tax=Protobothrops mucrosquamatus TaxID=103944 RepID=UPI000775F7D8|nr:zinc finger protein 648 [Protobothrops mucrosquamatus]
MVWSCSARLAGLVWEESRKSTAKAEVRDNSDIVKIANESCQDPIMEIQLDCELESDDCNSRGDQSSDFNSISDWVSHEAGPHLKVKEDNLTPFYLNRSPDTLSCHVDFSTKVLYGQQEISSKGFPKTSTYWRQQNPCTPGVYVPAKIIYNPASQDKDLEYPCFEISKDLHGQRAEEENFIILVDSNEDENISPQLGKTLPCRYQKYKSFQDLTMLQEHRKLHMARNSYRCPLCGKEFFRAANLRMHKLTHTKERPHKCPICNKGFIRTADVWRHLRSFHKIERSSVVLGNANMRNQWCTMKKNQDNKGNLKQLGSAASSLGKESSKPCICPVCHKAFRKPNLLSKHKVIHRQEKPYKCKECGMAFVQLARLKRHNLTHTGERPFSCERCNSTFTRSGSLQRHQRIHTGEKPYSCSYCCVSFTDLGTLKRHEQIHKVIQI